MLVNQAQVAPPYPGAVAVPAAGTGGGAAAISYQRFVQFLEGVATKVGTTLPRTSASRESQEFSTAFHSTSLIVLRMNMAWNVVGGLTAGKLCKVVPTGAARTTIIQKRAGPFN